ncbi:hypothetical protein Bca101_037384 [Brassica carinata]
MKEENQIVYSMLVDVVLKALHDKYQGSSPSPLVIITKLSQDSGMICRLLASLTSRGFPVLFALPEAPQSIFGITVSSSDLEDVVVHGPEKIPIWLFVHTYLTYLTTKKMKIIARGILLISHLKMPIPRVSPCLPVLIYASSGTFLITLSLSIGLQLPVVDVSDVSEEEVGAGNGELREIRGRASTMVSRGYQKGLAKNPKSSAPTEASNAPKQEKFGFI